MIRVIETDFNKLKPEEWNNLLSNSEVCDAFQTYEWGLVLKNSQKVEPQFLMILKGGEIIGGVMLYTKKLFGVFDCCEIRGGPQSIKGERTIVMRSIIKAFQKRKSKYVYLLLVPFPLINYDFKEVFVNEGYHPFPFRTVIIDLEDSLEKIWRALNKKARWGIRKAEKLGVEVKIAETWNEWEEFYKLYRLHSKEKKYPPEPYDFFKEMFKLISKKMACLFTAEHEKRIIAGSLFLVHNKNMIFLQNASMTAFRSYNPNNLIQWKSVEWAKHNGVTVYDLNGLPLEETKYLRGIYDYKKRWDGRIQWYYYYVNRKIVYNGIHLVRTNAFARNLYSYLRGSRVV